MHGHLVYLWFFGVPAALQEIEVTTFVSLCDVFAKEQAVAAFKSWGRLFPLLAPLLQLRLVNLQLKLPRLDVQLNQITCFHQSQGSANVRFWRHVKHASTVTGATHSRVRYADHIAHPIS